MLKSFLRKKLISKLMDHPAVVQEVLQRNSATAVRFCLDGITVLINLNSGSIVREFISGRYFGKTVLDEFLSAPSLSDNLINIGANVGVSAKYLSEKGAYDLTYAIEPDPGNYSLLVENCSGPRFKCLNVAVSDSKGELTLNLNATSSGRHSAFTSFGEAAINVPCDKLESLFPDTVADIFIDVEGWELKVLAGSHEVLSRAGKICLEWNPTAYTTRDIEKSIEILSSKNFGIYSVVIGTQICKMNFDDLRRLDEQSDLILVNSL